MKIRACEKPVPEVLSELHREISSGESCKPGVLLYANKRLVADKELSAVNLVTSGGSITTSSISALTKDFSRIFISLGRSR